MSSERGPSLAADTPQARENAERIAAFFREALTAGPAGRAVDFLAPDFQDRDPASGASGGRGDVAGKLAQLWSLVPDGRFEILDIVAAGDRVAVRSRLLGTAATPGSAAVDVAFFDLYRLAGGLIAEHWHVFDEAGMGRQLSGSR